MEHSVKTDQKFGDISEECVVLKQQLDSVREEITELRKKERAF